MLFFCIGPLHAQQGFLEYVVKNQDQNFYTTKAAMDTYYANRDRGRGSGYTHYRRWLMNTEKYVYPSGKMFNFSAQLTATFNRFIQTQPFNLSRATHGYWQSEGPSSYMLGSGWNGGNGRVNAIAFHPDDPNTIYACTPAGGLWVSTNNASTWEPLTDGLPSIGVSGIVINPQDPDIMYLLTGDGDGGHKFSIGVLKSMDGGVTWLPTGLTFNTTETIRGYKILMHPDDPDTVFVAASNGIWRTLNGGDDWTLEIEEWFTDIEFKPESPAAMYAVSLDDFYRSSNTGDTWTIDNDASFPAEWCRMAIGVTPANTNYVYLLFGGHVDGTGNGTFSGIYRSTNSGAGFTLRANTPNLLGYSSSGNDQANQACYDLALAIDPLNADIVYVGGINVWKSTNGGLTGSWTISAHWYEPSNTIGYTHADIHALEFKDATLYCGSDGGVFRSTNAGGDWINVSSGLANMQFYYLDVEVTTITGGTQDNGCNQWNISTDNAIHSRGADGFACLINYNNTSIRYQSTQGSKYRSINGGSSFTNISISGVSDYWDADWIMDPVDPQRLFLAQEDIWRTTTGGTGGWTDLNAGFTEERLITSLAQGVPNTSILYASDEVSLRKSADVLATTPTWSDKTTGLPVTEAMISDIAVDPANASRVWVTFYGLSNGNKVFFSSNGGDTWVNESGSLPNIPVNCVIYQSGSIDGLYIGTDFGVFYRNDDIGDWIFYSNGLPNARVFDLDIEGSTVYAATLGRGVWASSFYSCDTELVLTAAYDPSNVHFTGHQIYHASNTIASTQIITGGIGTDVQYNAGSSITLQEGFHARANNLFEAKLEGCPD
ncbi:MAG TPA: hypothetical protein VI603_03370 [Saprospiraceae bacterium]|nr:hypothetical protein [Saprospiraceae bacterium]